jgi:FKBP-type peptidyl-prolyl cis-trans isomerase
MAVISENTSPFRAVLLNLPDVMDWRVLNMTSELQMMDVVVGEGKEAIKGALIKTHYTGWLNDGTKFDSSHDRGQMF